MRVKKIWLVLTGIAAAAAVAGCASGTSNANVERAVAASTPTSSSSAAPSTTTTTAPPVTTTTPPTSTKKSTTTTKTTAQPAAAVPCGITEGACVDISAKKAWVISGGQVVYGPVPITTGRKGHATPTGTFKVLYKEKMHYSKEFDNAPMPNSVFFYPGDAFHTGSLSTPSHGCVHLSSTASLKFYNALDVGDPVQVVA